MLCKTVHSHAHSDATPDQLWAVVRDFSGTWHPLIDEMRAERTGRGGLVRRFTVKGDQTVYRERLTWFSESERSMGYCHVQGIDGIHHYEARLNIEAARGGACVTMSATLSAPHGRAEAIAEGTQAIFDLGTAAVVAQASGARTAGQVLPVPSAEIETCVFGTSPQLAVSVAGEDTDTLCLFLHGIGGNRTNWDRQLAAVAPVCRAAALDLRGYGGSTLGPEPSSIDGYCADILRVLEGFGARRLILCGLSYGAWIATSFAMRHPDRLAALVLSGGCTGMSEASHDEREAFRHNREAPLAEGKTPADFAPGVVDIIAGPEASEEARRAVLPAMQGIPAKTYADALRCFTNPLEQFDFAHLDMPVLLMTGAHDRLAPPSEIKRIAERIWTTAAQPDVRFEVIKGAGHVCNLERPDQYERILLDFIARVLL